MTRVVAIVEARMGSSRLPGKVLKDIAGKPALEILLERLNGAHKLDDVVVATSIAKHDDCLHDWCISRNVACWRGSEDDVLLRVTEAAEFAKADIIVEITGDCPLTDPKVVNGAISTYFSNDCDVVTNCGNVLTWPMGIYAQVFSLRLLKDVAENIFDPAVREHVSLHFYENSDKYKIIDIIAPDPVRKPQLRCQLDYDEDLIFLNEVFAGLKSSHGFSFDTNTLIRYLDEHPELLKINSNCLEKNAR